MFGMDGVYTMLLYCRFYIDRLLIKINKSLAPAKICDIDYFKKNLSTETQEQLITLILEYDALCKGFNHQKYIDEFNRQFTKYKLYYPFDNITLNDINTANIIIDHTLQTKNQHDTLISSVETIEYNTLLVGLKENFETLKQIKKKELEIIKLFY